MPAINTIAQFIESQGITAYAFAQQTGVTGATVYSLKNNPSQWPHQGTVEKICQAYGVQPGDFLRWEGEDDI